MAESECRYGLCTGGIVSGTGTMGSCAQHYRRVEELSSGRRCQLPVVIGTGNYGYDIRLCCRFISHRQGYYPGHVVQCCAVFRLLRDIVLCCPVVYFITLYRTGYFLWNFTPVVSGSLCIVLPASAVSSESKFE